MGVGGSGNTGGVWQRQIINSGGNFPLIIILHKNGRQGLYIH